jgi:outer membrane protein TolC
MLNYLSGIADTVVLKLDTPYLVVQPPASAERTVFYNQFVYDSLKLQNDKAVSDINYRPKFNLFADAGFNSTLTYSPYKNFGTSFGLSAVIPIYDGKQRKLQYSKIAIAERALAGYRSFFLDQYTQQTTQLVKQIHQSEGLIKEMNQQLKYAGSLMEANKKLLQTGDVLTADYILSLNAYLNARNQITQQNISRLQLINQLNYWNR